MLVLRQASSRLHPVSRRSADGRWLLAVRRLRTPAAALLLTCTAAASSSESPHRLPLPALNIDLSQTSVSGVSSGGFMAVQIHAAHASQIIGAGVFAGGPYRCAGSGNMISGIQMALNVCMSGDADTEASLQQLNAAYRAGQIDNPAAQMGDRVWLYSGYNDGVVRQGTMSALDRYYRRLTLPELVYYKSSQNAGHAQITADTHQQDCKLNGGIFINNCHYDAAGLLLQHIYGSLQPAAVRPPDSHLLAFAQSPWIGKHHTALLAEEGYVYIPRDCEQGAECRLHIALHGCLQNASRIGDHFYRGAGYNEWADTNRLVILYPQANSSSGVYFNPKGCWDWWGYSDPLALHSDYASRNSPQIAAIWNMASQLASGYQATAAGPGPSRQWLTSNALPADVTLALSAADSSHDQIALHWPATPHGRYRLYRAEQANGPFTLLNPATPVLAGSFADIGLQPLQRYFYRLEQINNQNQVIASSATVSRITGARPAICDPWFGTIDEHLLTGRAYRSYLDWSVRVTGSNERLGALWGEGDVGVTLQRTGTGQYRVGNCPDNGEPAGKQPTGD